MVKTEVGRRYDKGETKVYVYREKNAGPTVRDVEALAIFCQCKGPGPSGMAVCVVLPGRNSPVT
jgi:hypothetical protein